jgi:hypothetical protein
MGSSLGVQSGQQAMRTLLGPVFNAPFDRFIKLLELRLDLFPPGRIRVLQERLQVAESMVDEHP